VKPPATAGRDVTAAIGGATPLTLPEAPQGAKVSSVPLAAAALSLNPRIQGASSSDALPLLVILVFGLILACAGGRLAVLRWRRRQRWRLEAAEWQAAYRRIQPERAPAVSKPSESLRRIDLGSDFVIRRAESGGGGSQDPRPAKQKTAKAKRKPAKAK
jgi:hypothetical protein